MNDDVNRLEILRIDGDRAERLFDAVSRERVVKVLLGGMGFATLTCSPKDLDCLAVGLLCAEGLIRDRDDLRSVSVDEGGTVRVETVIRESSDDDAAKLPTADGCGKAGASTDLMKDLKALAVESPLAVSRSSVHPLLEEFLRSSETYGLTGAVHAAAICDERNILVFKEDISRRNAIDKAVGDCILKGISTDHRIMISSGRITYETVLRVARSRIPVIISKSAPTDLAVELARSLEITVIGFARENRMNVYSREDRVVTDTIT
ncbi:MAG: formate dehydrogenase accessory sulfurtransferase FdhD [Methanobacteriota archaeon]|nr:MAG: formate dehydrogenase accessory sulfurtransferase FdhD [Euryarchaeota archaeon]